MESFKDLPRELLHNIFKYLDYRYIHRDIVRYMYESEIINMLPKDYDLIANNPYAFNLYRKYKEVEFSRLFIENLSNKFIEKFASKLDWNTNKKFKTGFVSKFCQYIDWRWYSQIPSLSESFIEEFEDYVDWDNIVRYNRFLSAKFMKRHHSRLDFDLIAEYHKVLPMRFIIQFRKRFNLDVLVKYKKLTEEYIIRNNIDLKLALRYQNLSIEFLIENKDKIGIDNILSNNRYFMVKEVFIEKFAHEFTKENWCNLFDNSHRLPEEIIKKMTFNSLDCILEWLKLNNCPICKHVVHVVADNPSMNADLYEILVENMGNTHINYTLNNIEFNFTIFDAIC